MSKSKIAGYILLLAAVAAVFFYFYDSSLINEAYLSSEKYQQLQKELDKEHARIESENRDISEVFSKLVFSESSPQLNLPVQLDSLSIRKYLSDSPRLPIEPQGLDKPPNRKFNYYNLGVAVRDSIEIVFVLVERASVYLDIEVWMATRYNNSFVDVEGIARFKNSITDRVHTELLIGEDSIEADMQRIRKYPIFQQAEERYRYLINGQGEISEEIP